MFIGFYPLPVEIFIIVFSAFLAIYILVKPFRRYFSKFEKYIIALAALNLCLLFMLIGATRWPVSGDGLYEGSRELLETRQYLSFWERYLEFIALIISYFFVLLMSCWYYIKNSLHIGKNKKIIFLICFILMLWFALFFLLPSNLSKRYEFIIWTDALLQLPHLEIGRNSPYFFLSNFLGIIILIIEFTFPESLVLFILINKIRKGKI